MGVVGKVGLALLGGTTGGVAKARGIIFCICGGYTVRAGEVVLLVGVCETVECGIAVEDESWMAERVMVGCSCGVSGICV